MGLSYHVCNFNESIMMSWELSSGASSLFKVENFKKRMVGLFHITFYKVPPPIHILASVKWLIDSLDEKHYLRCHYVVIKH